MTKSFMLRVGAAILIAPATLVAQQAPRADTARLNTVVVTADRAPSAISSSVASVTRISGAELARMPQVTLADVLRLVPGFSVANFDGAGYDPQLMARGFYGGGEAEYVVVLVNGRPVNQLHTGVVAWDALPPIASIESIEVVRGGASSLYGDAAVAGVINVVTRRPPGAGRELRLDAAGGSNGAARAAVDVSVASLLKGVGLSGAFDRTEGFRTHSSRNTQRARVSAGLLETADSRLALSLNSNWRAFDEPGALLESLLKADERGSDPLFRFDHTVDRTHGVLLDGAHRSGRTRFTGSASGEYRAIDAIRTLALAPGFGDTKERDATMSRAGASLQAEIDDSPLPGSDRVILGIEGTHDDLDSRYYKFAGGPRASYTSKPARGALDTEGSSTRNAVALYGDYSAHPVPSLRISLGARLDRLKDAFDRVTPTATTASSTHTAVSPKVGANYEYLNADGSTGNVFVAVSRSFKAPTLDQLYDQRRIPVPFPPFQITTSNTALVPQHGVSVEGGLYHGVRLGADRRLAGSLSTYQIDMVDELDFDVQTFRYVNLGRSRHRGVEGGLNLEGGGAYSFVSYTLQEATSRSGDNQGKRLKAIPRHTLNGGVSVSPLEHVDASLTATHVAGMYLDDANTITLPAYTRVDLRVGLRWRDRSLFAEARNVLDAHYSTTGFTDPGGTSQLYFYPAAGRMIDVGVRAGF